jgi:plastocyanin
MPTIRPTSLFSRRFLALLTCLFLALQMPRAFAAQVNVTWDFTVAPPVVNINAGDSVKWNGSMSFHPIAESNASFSTVGPTLSGGGASFTRTFATPGTYYFICTRHSSMRTTVNVASVVCNPPVVTAALDIDANGSVDAATDGLLALRYMLGFRDAELVNGAVGACPGRDTAGIQSYLATKVVP